MTPERIAFTAGVAWLELMPGVTPDCNDLAWLLDEVDLDVDRLALVKACIPVADAVAAVQRWQSMAAQKLAAIPAAPRW